jgi:four helix bundle protein
MARHDRLLVWQQGQDLAVIVYRASATWPSSERFGLTIQVRRAAVSVPANIAEGAARYGRAEFGRFLNIAAGSLGELASLLHLANKLGYIGNSDYAALMDHHASVGRLLSLLRRSMRPR